MLKFKNLIAFLFILGLLLCSVSQIVFSEDEEFCVGGGKTMTQEQFAEFRQKKPEIVSVKLNEKGIEALQKANPSLNVSKLMAAEMGDETITCDESMEEISTPNDVKLFNEETTYKLPASCDVSQNNSFPPIKDQGSGALTCGAWAYGYYQATNNISNIRGCNAKNTDGGNDPTKYQIQPQWQYTLINGGANNSTYDIDNINALISYGSLNWYDYAQAKLGMSDSTWHPESSLWETALKNKFEGYEYIELDTETGIENLKKLLLNGYVVSFHTQYSNRYLPNWSTIASKTAPGSTGPAKQQVCYYVRSAAYGHFMTIAGYNDDIWADVNNNGVVDSGEQGAFLVVNSEGTGFKNGGYVWLLYDAINAKSRVSGVETQNGRVKAISNSAVFFLKPRVEYSPLLLAEVTLNTARRNQVGIEIGISPITTNTPSQTEQVAKYDYIYSEDVLISYYENIAFNFPNNHHDSAQRGGYNFTGGTSAADGDFIFDLTPIAQKYMSNMEPNTSYRFYIKVTDNTEDSHPTVLKTFKVIDRKNNVSLGNDTTLQLAANNSTVTAYIDCTVVPKLVSRDKQFSLTFSSPLQSSTVSNNNIFIKDMNNINVAGTSLSSNSYQNIWTLSPPSGGYSNGYYKLYVMPGIKSAGGNQLENKKIIDFYVP